MHFESFLVLRKYQLVLHNRKIKIIFIGPFNDINATNLSYFFALEDFATHPITEACF